MEAVTFAEAGMPDHAMRVMAEAQAERLKIVVVSEGEHLGKCLIDHVLELAERLKREIVAVLVIPAASPSQPVVLEAGDPSPARAAESSLRAIERFRTDAAHKGIPFRLMIGHGKLESIVAKLSSEIRRIDFVIVPRQTSARSLSVPVSVPVFNVVC
jgi:nucleotide-binding universal stress UspA family protein